MVLSWRISKGFSIPLMFTDLNKGGTSNTQERLDLLRIFDKVFGIDRIKFLIADREFVGANWFTTLNRKDIPYTIRVKKNMLLPWGKVPIPARDLFQHLKVFETRLIEKRMYEDTVYFAGTISQKGEFVIVMTNQPLKASQILIKYRQRWSIEELFRKLKSSGFHWENTHMKESKRLVALLILLSFGLLFASLVGREEKIPWKKTINYPLYSLFKQGLVTLQFLLSKSSELAAETIQILLEKIQNVLFA